MNRLLIVIIPIMMIISYSVGLFQGQSTQVMSTNREGVPSPTMSLALKQQCATAANALVTRLNQEQARIDTTAPSFLTTSGNAYRMSKTVYNPNHNSCFAEIDSLGKDNGSNIVVFHVYDTLSGELVAQDDLSHPENNFIPNKLDDVTSYDYFNFKASLGL